jgi:hypothetical protein
LILDIEEELRHMFILIRDNGAQRVVRAYEVDNTEVAGDGVFDDSVGELDGC